MPPVLSISVLMPTRQGIELLERVLAALAAQRCATPWDFRAIDAGSTDGTWERLEHWSRTFPVPFVLERIDPVELDPGDTRNLLAARSSGELLVFLEQDAIPRDPDWLAKLAASFVHPRVGAVCCRAVPRSDARLLARILGANDATMCARTIPFERRALDVVASAVRRELWERHPFPRTPFGADVLMLRALIEAGFTVVDDDAAAVEHGRDLAPAQTRAHAELAGRFAAEWLGRASVPTEDDARILAVRALEQDARALESAGLSGAALETALVEAAELRTAWFDGLHAGGRSAVRRSGTRMLPSKRLKVLQVSLGFPPDTWAGCEVYTLELARELRARGHEVVVLTRATESRSVADGGPHDFSLKEDLFEGLRVLRVTNRLQYASLRAGYLDTRAEAVFQRVLEREKPDVVHFQHVIHQSASLVDVARREGLATLFTLHDYWALCPRVILFRPDGVRCEGSQGAGCFLCAKDKHLDRIGDAKLAGLRLPPVAELAAGDAGRVEYEQLMARHEIVPAAYAAADLRIAPSRFLRDKHLEVGGFDPYTLVYSAYGLRADATPAATKRPDPQGRVRFGFIGTLVLHKGVATLLSAMRRLVGRDCVLHVFGEHRPDADAYHALLRELAGANVVFHGRFDNARIAAVFAEIDVLVVPSIWFENAPITIQEAHLRRTPVVTSNIGGMAELVRDGVDGLHFEVEDDADLAAKLARFLDEPGLLAALSRDFPRIKTMREDAAETEFRYRQLACVARTREPAPGPRLLFDAPGLQTASRAGGAEQQGADLLLLRAGTGAAAEYDVRGVGGGARRIRVVQCALASEPTLPLGVRVWVDDVRVGGSAAFNSGGRDGVHACELDLDMPVDARRLRVEPLPHGEGETYARIARVQVELERRAPSSNGA